MMRLFIAWFLLLAGGNITISGLVSHWRYIPSIDARTAMKDIKLAAIGSSNYVDVMMTNTPSEYVKALKDCAARRISLSTNERNDIISTFFSYIDNLDGNLLSNSVWSLGVLDYNMRDFQQLNIENLNIKIENICRTSTFDNIDLQKLVSGLAKIGFTWNTLPSQLTRQYLDLLRMDNVLDARDVANIIYNLGKLKASDILESDSQLVIRSALSDVAAFTTQGYSNSIHGLARLGIEWTMLTPANQTAILAKFYQYVTDLRNVLSNQTVNSVGSNNILKFEEFLSILQSLAIMKVDWNKDFPFELRQILLPLLSSSSKQLRNNEISNLIWSFGKFNMNSQSDNKLNQQVIRLILEQLEVALPTMSNFDIESVFVGLGLLKLQYKTLNRSLQIVLIDTIGKNINRMNIFCLYNVLWGLARMGCRKEDLSSSIANRLLTKTIDILHTFLPIHYGDVIWSLGSLGYNVKVDLSPTNFGRLLAIISRIYPKLHVRAAAYTLWGLSRMDVTWEDLVSERKSLINGNNISPLSEGIFKYLKTRVASMKEHEYSVLVYSLGELRVDWNNIPVVVKEKIFHRLTRVTSFITSRSLANLLYGFGKCGVKWSDIPAVSQQAILDSLTTSRSELSCKKGLLMMNSLEIAQTTHALGLMSVNWTADLDTQVQTTLLDAINNSLHLMSLEGKHATTLGLISMNLPEKILPIKLKSLVGKSFEGVEWLKKDIPSNLIDDEAPAT